jgi:hypothetical protein
LVGHVDDVLVGDENGWMIEMRLKRGRFMDVESDIRGYWGGKRICDKER